MFTMFSRPMNAIRGMGNAVSASWTSSMAGGRSLKGALLGGRGWRNPGMYAGAGAAVGAGVGFQEDGLSGAVKGGLLGAGAGFAGSVAANNWRGIRRLGQSAVEGARRSW